MPKLRTFVLDLYLLGKPYLTSNEWLSAWCLIVGLVILNLSQVAVGLVITYSQSIFYTALQQKDSSGFLRGLFWFTARKQSLPMPPFLFFVMLNLSLYALSSYTQAWLQVRWQRWMTASLVQDWLANQAHYRMMIASADRSVGGDNPDQRIQEDVEDVTRSTISLSFGFITSVVTAFSYGGLLWSLSGTVLFLGVELHGYLFCSALLYAALFTWVTHLVGRPLAWLSFQQQRLRGNFRYSLMKVREHAEAIALLRGEAEERRGLKRRFDDYFVNFMQIARRTASVTFMALGFDQASIIFPTVLAAPQFFAGAITFGTLNQIRLGFLTLAESLLWFVSSYVELAAYVAQVERLATFVRAIDATSVLTSKIEVHESSTDALALRDFSVSTPHGRNLVTSASLSFPPGSTTAFVGSSGGGKSTLFRAMAGIWPFAAGEMSRSTAMNLFLPQSPYIPEGTLRRALCYPGGIGMVADEALHSVLAEVGLQALVPAMDVETTWSQKLSPGEQQRLSIARALLLKPAWLFLDEATSSLEDIAACEMHLMMRRLLPATALISITHNFQLARLHERVFTLTSDNVILEDAV